MKTSALGEKKLAGRRTVYFVMAPNGRRRKIRAFSIIFGISPLCRHMINGRGARPFRSANWVNMVNENEMVSESAIERVLGTRMQPPFAICHCTYRSVHIAQNKLIKFLHESNDEQSRGEHTSGVCLCVCESGILLFALLDFYLSITSPFRSRSQWQSWQCAIVCAVRVLRVVVCARSLSSMAFDI